MEIKVGDRFTTNKGGDVVVVEYVKADKIIVEFTDSNKHRVVTTKTVLLKGDIKNPFSPLLFGVGYMGVGSYKAKDGSSSLGFGRTQSYSAWANMLSRCYDPSYSHPETYTNVEVDKDWHNYQVFAEWYLRQTDSMSFNGTLCLDKDILTDAHTYSESNCCIVPYAINSVVKGSKGGKYLQGVKSRGNRFYTPFGKYVSYATEIEAHIAYVKFKSNKIREVAIEYQHYLSTEVFNALMTRDFRYKFSPLFEPETKVTLH